jgi:hypothetical protein
MKLIEVNDKKTAKRFLEVARILYKNDPNWICPLDNDTEAIFDPDRNPYFQHGKAIRWILENDKGQLIGRVGAFINFKKASIFKQPTGGMGFFECIDDQKAAFTLFDACQKWNQANGMEAMDGPINFGENDNFWGLLVEGFMPQSYGMNYHPPYYKKLFESYGFHSYFEQVTNHLDMEKPFPERFWKIADWVAKKPGFTYEHFTFSDSEKYIRDLKKVYDEAWVYHEHFTPLDMEDLRAAIKKAKPIIDEEVIWFVYHEGEPVAFLVMFPDVNQIFRHLNGKLHLLNKLRFLYYKKRKEIRRTRITVMGVVPRFQRYGLESGIFAQLREVFNRRPQYAEVELSWVGDFNPKMRALHEAVGGKFAKRHITYRKLFDQDAEKQNASSIPVNSREIYVSEKKTEV